MIFKSIIKIVLAKLRFGNNSITPETDPSLIANAQQYICPVNVPIGFKNNHSNRLGFMEGEGRVPDNFNTMGAKEIENLFMNGR